MKAARGEKPDRRVVYRQGGRRVYVEPLENVLAVRFREGASRDVHEILDSLGRVQVIESQRLLIVEFSGQAQRAIALEKLRRLVDKGVLEFVTPLLLDADTDLRQILTDEITVRFKSMLPPRRLKAVEQEFGVTVARQNEFVPNQFVMKVASPEGLHTLEVASQLDAADEVEFATPNLISDHLR